MKPMKHGQEPEIKTVMNSEVADIAGEKENVPTSGGCLPGLHGKDSPWCEGRRISLVFPSNYERVL